MRYEHSLDALNFFLADVRQGLGPYLAIYLLTERHWAQDQIGFVMTIATLGVVCGLMVQTPAGALTDSSHTKRAIIVIAALVVTGASILLPFVSSFVLVAGSQAAADAAAAFFGPVIAAITLGLIRWRNFRRCSRSGLISRSIDGAALGAGSDESLRPYSADAGGCADRFEPRQKSDHCRRGPCRDRRLDPASLYVFLCPCCWIASGGRRSGSFFRAGDRRDHFGTHGAAGVYPPHWPQRVLQSCW
jgi:hypothetical protein